MPLAFRSRRDLVDFRQQLDAAPASCRALLAMVHLVPGAFAAAGFACFRTDCADPKSEIRITGEFARSQRTDICATAIKLDAADHHFDILFCKAGGGAMFTGNDAGLAGFYAFLIFIVDHKCQCFLS